MRAPASHAGCSSPPCRSSGTVMLSASAHQPRGAPRPQRCSKARGACNSEGQTLGEVWSQHRIQWLKRQGGVGRRGRGGRARGRRGAGRGRHGCGPTRGRS